MEKYGDTFNSDQIDSSNIAVIYAHELENIIRLCRDKKQIRKKIKGKENSQIVDEDDIYSRISRVVDSLSKADAQLIRTDHQLNVKKIKEKINPDEFNLLFRKVRDNVCEYYGFVNDIFVERQKEQDVVYTAIQERIHKHYLKIADRDKPVVFHEMVDWLSKDANADSEACEIIISIFIRKCEVL
ncbi:ABC-three component system protein [Hallerella succinigenes]|uniref:ABC-three component system protein n=1 Tax=Hallerella succinigenes TaxID=1896222 RepID=UPI000C2347F2|nr:ABC-three component system protein [Hallerella succinigenes]